MNFLHLGTDKDASYNSFLKACLPPGTNLITKSSSVSYLYEVTKAVEMVAAKYGQGVHGIILSCPQLLAKYVHVSYGGQIKDKDPATLHNYQGAMFSHKIELENGRTYKIPVVVITPLEHLTYDQGKRYLTATYISKLWNKDWFTAPRLLWSEPSLDELPNLWRLFNSPECILCSIDIETQNMEVNPELSDGTVITTPEGTEVSLRGMTYIGKPRTGSGLKGKRLVNLMPWMDMVGYTGIFKDSQGSLTSLTIIIRMRSPEHYQWIKKFNQIPAPKVLQNGLYDNTWLLRFDAPVYNWVYDTYGLMHSWLVELPRGLAAVSAIALRNHMYWKDEVDSNRAEYCAKDCHATAWSCIALLDKIPDYAYQNYVSTFKQVFPALSCNLEGFAEDPTESNKLWHKYKDQVISDQVWWDRVVVKNFNVGSSQQVKQLFKDILGADIKSSDRNTLEGIADKHPLWRMLVDKLFDTREARKADSTYMNIDLFCGRILYALDPFGTDTSRYACRASSFWCGTQIQNIPLYTKSKFAFDPGWNGFSSDGQQAESRTTAYITGEEKMIDAVENAKDFHTRNASMFFGMTEEAMFLLKKNDPTFYKILRNEIGKRINHGANYNMMEAVLIATMTPRRIIQAKVALKLPAKWTFYQVANHLLGLFDKTYPKVRSKKEGGYHYRIIEEVAKTGKLVTPDGWTRRTFLRPGADRSQKMDLNALVAHLPQSWSARILNKVFFNVWYELQIQKRIVRLKAQIHDEILGQCIPEHTDYVKERISELSRQPNQIGERTMVIPNDFKAGARLWSELKD